MTKILYSPGHGAGWSSWNSGSSQEFKKWLLTYQPVIDAIERDERLYEGHPLLEQLKREAKDKFGEEYVCTLGAGDLEIYEVTGPFRIDEYDGHENVIEGTSDYISV